MKLLEKILFATDFCHSSNDALHTTTHVAKKFNSEVNLLHVIPELELEQPYYEIVEENVNKRLELIKKDLEVHNIRKNQSDERTSSLQHYSMCN